MRSTSRRLAALAAACLVVAGVLLARPVAAQTNGNGQTGASGATSPAATAYLDAVRRGDVAAVEKALADGIEVDTKFRYDRTALSFAADRGHVDVVKLLLAKGANVDLTDSYYNQTALGWASSPAQARRPEHVQVVGLLLDKGAKGGLRALMAAIGANDIAMVQVILDHGLPAATLSELLATAKKDDKTAVVAALQKAGAVMPVVATLTPAQLARYPGTYKAEATNVGTVTVKDGVVSITFGGPTFVLSPRSETLFVADGSPGVTGTFAFDADKAISLTVVNQMGASTVYTRVQP